MLIFRYLKNKKFIPQNNWFIIWPACAFECILKSDHFLLASYSKRMVAVGLMVEMI